MHASIDAALASDRTPGRRRSVSSRHEAAGGSSRAFERSTANRCSVGNPASFCRHFCGISSTPCRVRRRRRGRRARRGSDRSMSACCVSLSRPMDRCGQGFVAPLTREPPVLDDGSHSSAPNGACFTAQSSASGAPRPWIIVTARTLEFPTIATAGVSSPPPPSEQPQESPRPARSAVHESPASLTGALLVEPIVLPCAT